LAKPQLSFSGEAPITTTSTTALPEVVTRVGPLLADVIGVDPLGVGGQGQQGRNPRPNSNSGSNNNQGQLRSSCCCSRTTLGCPNPRNQDNLGGLINPRLKPTTPATPGATTTDEVDPRQGRQENLEDFVATRIVNNPPSEPLNQQCPQGYRQCCYDPQDTRSLNELGSCVSPDQIRESPVSWQQGCRENLRNFGNRKQCGQRSFKPLFNLEKGQASPEEFPWSCIMLDGDNKFLGSCAIVPERTDNDIRRGTRKVITAAHKLKLQKSDELKVRIIEYDASDFTSAEKTKHEEFTVVSFKIHPRFNPNRLSDDIAVLTLDRRINLTEKNNGRRPVNAACYPGCNNMFDYQFNNGTGVRCWVAGWGRDATKEQGGQFSFIQKKVDVPIYNRDRCEARLRQELSRKSQSGRRFELTDGELCAGGEAGKDSCDGDGGAPLVCQSQSGHWHVVGLVAWGIGCANPDVPAVYVNVYHYLDFIITGRA